MNFISNLLRLSLTNPTEAGAHILALRLNLGAALSAFAVTDHHRCGFDVRSQWVSTHCRIARIRPNGSCGIGRDHGAWHLGPCRLYLAGRTGFWRIGPFFGRSPSLCLDSDTSGGTANCANRFDGDLGYIRRIDQHFCHRSLVLDPVWLT